MKAGLGKAIITPRMSMWLAGYAHRDRPSEGTLCDLFVKTLCLEDEGGRRFFLTTTDLLGIPRSLSLKISTAVGRRFGVPRERLILTSSHTHSGPVLEGGLIDLSGLGNDQLALVNEYSAQLVNQLRKNI